MHRVTLVMAQGPGFPGGSAEHRYDLAVALTPAGLLDAGAWVADPNPWPAGREWPGSPPRQGEVLWEPEHGWSLHFAAADGEPAMHARLSAPGQLRPGEHLTITEPDGRGFGWRVVSLG